MLYLQTPSVTVMIDWTYSPGIYTALTELVCTGENDLRPTLHTDTAFIIIILLPHPKNQKEVSNGKQERGAIYMYKNIVLTSHKEQKKFIKI